VDEWITSYNTLRPHSGRYYYGKTPMQTFQDAKHLAVDKQLHRLNETSRSEPLALGTNGSAHRVDRQGHCAAESDP